MKKLILIMILLVLGNLLFAKDFIETKEGNFIFVTSAESFSKDKPVWKDFENKGDTDGVLVMFDKDFKEVKKIGFGGKGDDNLDGICEYQDYLYVIGTAWENSFESYDFKDLKSKGRRDCIIAKFDKNLNLVKCVNFGSSEYDFVSDIAISPDGEIYVAGRIYNSDNTESAFVVNFNTDLQAKKFVKYKGNYDENTPAVRNEFSSLCFSDINNLIIVGAVANDDDEAPLKGVLTEYDKNLNLIKDKVIDDSLSLSFQNIIPFEKGYSVCGYGIPYEWTCGFFACFDKNFEITNILTYNPNIETEGEYPVIGSMSLILNDKDKYYIFGNAGLYKGNGDYDDEGYHSYLLPFDKNGIISNKRVILPKDTEATIVKDGKAINLIFNREKGEPFKIIATDILK